MTLVRADCERVDDVRGGDHAAMVPGGMNGGHLEHALWTINVQRGMGSAGC